MSMLDGEAEHLGDGLYAYFDGYQIILYADREGGRHWVAIEPDVFDRLTEFNRRLEKAKDEYISQRNAHINQLDSGHEPGTPHPLPDGEPPF